MLQTLHLTQIWWIKYRSTLSLRSNTPNWRGKQSNWRSLWFAVKIFLRSACMEWGQNRGKMPLWIHTHLELEKSGNKRSDLLEIGERKSMIKPGNCILIAKFQISHVLFFHMRTKLHYLLYSILGKNILKVIIISSEGRAISWIILVREIHCTEESSNLKTARKKGGGLNEYQWLESKNAYWNYNGVRPCSFFNFLNRANRQFLLKVSMNVSLILKKSQKIDEKWLYLVFL